MTKHVVSVFSAWWSKKSAEFASHPGECHDFDV